MKIRDFLKEHFEKRVHPTGCLVFYDPEGRYLEIVRMMESDGLAVIDGSNSTILGREKAMQAWRRLADPSDSLRYMVIYLPVPRPVTETDIQKNPYQPFALGGSEFPVGDGDSYLALCRQAKHDFVDRIEELFSGGVPDFDTVDAVDGGQNWPKLTSILKVVSPVEIVVAVLSPSEAQKKALERDEAWPVEFRSFAGAVLGLKLKTKSLKWKSIREELARYVLFSELALDLPEELPEELRNVPQSSVSHKSLIFTVCDMLREMEKHRETYVDMANTVTVELGLEERLKSVADFGERVTFSFEERTFLGKFVAAVDGAKYEEARKIALGRKKSIWATLDPERQLLWVIAERGLELIVEVETLERAWKNNGLSLTEIFGNYKDGLYRLDALNRELLQAEGDLFGESGAVSGLVEKAHKMYLGRAEKVQALFLSLVEKEGWPPAGSLKQAQIFDKFVAPALDTRERIAYILVDALRFELGVELKAKLIGDSQVELHAAAAQLPTITRVGMAALMPGADGNFIISHKDNETVPEINGEPVIAPKDRLKIIQKQYGDRVSIIGLNEFLKGKKLKLDDKVQLLLIKALEIDELGESFAHDAASLMPEALKKLPAAVAKLRQLGFDQVIVATDHGFILLDEQGPGDVAEKPAGEWPVQKGRFLLGNGAGSAGTAVFESAHIGIHSKMENLAVPRSFGTFSKSDPYFHGGVSLQECVLPVLHVRSPKKKQKEQPQGRLVLSYKSGNTNLITTRRPMVDIALFKEHMQARDWLEFSLEAYSGDKIVGEAASCDYLEPATNLVKVQYGQAVKVPLRIDEDFEGAFEVRAVDPATQASYAVLKLKTNFMDI